MRIAIDIDSTLHHYWDQFRAAAQELHGVELPYEGQTTWGITRLEPEQARACIVHTHQAHIVATGVPYDHAVETVNAWHAGGHFIHITSHRHPDSHDATVAWLNTIGLRHDELYCSFDKISRCREIGIDLLIDDSPVNLQRALEAGIAGATIAHPWNRDVLAREPGIVAADAWPELAAALTPWLARAA